MSDTEFRDHLKYAAQQVSTWPVWKQKFLEQSSKPTVDVPRAPVDNRRVVEETYGPRQTEE